ncbi:MAG TPA: GrpB family protein [Steroidobacteraceae bacterium]|nr:GrpB family protein [Steroidobacteraceae bacterium]
MRDFPTDIPEIRDYDPAWPDVFAKLAARARTALGSLVLTVEHIGSTSVPGLAAKPIIDLDVVLASPADPPEAIRRLARIGYAHEGDLGIAGRDALRADPDLRDSYGALKRSLAERYNGDRDSYTHAKSEFINSRLRRMR